MSDSSELHYPMTCPFCGGIPNMAFAKHDGLSMCAMRCAGCGAQGPPKMLPGQAAEAWDDLRCQFRRRATDRDYGLPGDDDEPGPKPPVTPKTPVMA